VTTTPDPAPAPSLEAAATAAARAVTFGRLAPGPVVPGGRERPTGLAFLVACAVSGALEGTITVAADDELVERLEYSASVSGAADALRPVTDAMVAALGGRVEATPPVEIEAGEWPGDSPVMATVELTGSTEADDEAEDTLLVVAFDLTVVPAPGGDDDEVVRGRGRSAMSTSGGTVPSYRPSAGGTTGGRLSAEARRLGAVEVDVAAVLGETTVILHELLGWLPGVIVSLHRDVGMPVDVRIDDATVAHAEIVVLDERYALRVIDVIAGAQARVARQQRSLAQPGAGEPHP
jgi:flagellar motor switch protein FliN/FliY